MSSMCVVELPEIWHGTVADGVATLARSAGDRYCLLLKTRIGWKGNFEGVFCCDPPLNPSEIIDVETNRPYVSVADMPPFEELYIRGRISEAEYRVFFDLN